MPRTMSHGIKKAGSRVKALLAKAAAILQWK